MMLLVLRIELLTYDICEKCYCGREINSLHFLSIYIKYIYAVHFNFSWYINSFIRLNYHLYLNK